MRTWLHSLIATQQDRIILFTPFGLALGILLYFSMDYEPHTLLGAGATLLLAIVAYGIRAQRAALLIVMGLLIFSCGFSLAQLRTHSINIIPLKAPLSFAEITGTIEEIEQTPKGSKLFLKHVSIKGLAAGATPVRLSLTYKMYDPTLRSGQTVAVRGGLFPPPEQAMPGGFDFARHYFFRQIGAVGYGIPPITVLPTETKHSFALWFAELRHRLTQSIRSHFDEPHGSIAAAFVTGQTASIPETVNEEMRIAGIYHLLAVSGLNLSIVAGIAFFAVRLMLAAIPALALRYNIKKWAAAAALCVSFFYLQLAGSPVSAERAFLMVSLIFIAILLDRDPSPMRAIAAAATLILCFTPEAVLSASFQLSFSATAAIVSAYEWVASRVRGKPSGFGIGRVVFYFIAVTGTSLVAWLGTEPIIIYHFHQFSTYSLLTNTLAEPLVSFILMPLVVVGVLLMAVGLGTLAFSPLQVGIDLLLSLSRWIASLPNAMLLIPPPTDVGFFIICCGLVWLYFWRGWLRLAGLLMVAAGFTTLASYQIPDLLINADGRNVAARMDDASVAMLKGRNTSFTAEQWERAMLVQAIAPYKEAPLECDRTGCLASLHGLRVALPKTAESAMEDCNLADIIIAGNLSLPADVCHASWVFDKAYLESNGATAIHIEGKSLSVKSTKMHSGARPWRSIASPTDPAP